MRLEKGHLLSEIELVSREWLKWADKNRDDAIRYNRQPRWVKWLGRIFQNVDRGGRSITLPN